MENHYPIEYYDDSVELTLEEALEKIKAWRESIDRSQKDVLYLHKLHALVEALEKGIKDGETKILLS